MGKVPGTFKTPPLDKLVPLRTQGAANFKQHMIRSGVSQVEVYMLGECQVFVVCEPVRSGGYRWHLSISHDTRYPTWDEIKTARYLAPELADVAAMAQMLPKLAADSEWVNVHENCFHLHEVIDPEWAAN